MCRIFSRRPVTACSRSFGGLLLGRGAFVNAAIYAGRVARLRPQNESRAAWVVQLTEDVALSDQVLSLFAADALEHPSDYEMELSVCDVCGAVSLSASSAGVASRRGLPNPSIRHQRRASLAHHGCGARGHLAFLGRCLTACAWPRSFSARESSRLRELRRSPWRSCRGGRASRAHHLREHLHWFSRHSRGHRARTRDRGRRDASRPRGLPGSCHRLVLRGPETRAPIPSRHGARAGSGDP